MNAKNVRSLRAFWTWLARIGELSATEDIDKLGSKAPTIKILSDGIYNIMLRQADAMNDEEKCADPYGFFVYNSPTRQ